ncbi:uncharacterized protein LOC127749672 [Frankliniella occidentalis]|uniref:Uncharacterized protein LOC127749672 n=1 Tax=Frankliniella occidentalis TaxID=133901 RepID=A0A9C6X0D0_FRAOC|nr:uncharacterized protein LOC127749672 [Frankliniella occidentalis]
MSAFIFVVVVLAHTSQRVICGTTIYSAIGPYRAFTERFYECNPHPRPWRWHFRTTRFNPYKPKEIQLLTGNITLGNKSFDDSLPITVILDTRSNNQWKENAFIFTFKSRACTTIKTNIPVLYEQLFKKREINGVCSHQPGVYEVNNAPVEWIFPNFPMMPYGFYKFKIKFGTAENLIMCGVVECRIIPRLE